jgi:hypothetical protein
LLTICTHTRYFSDELVQTHCGKNIFHYPVKQLKAYFKKGELIVKKLKL